MGRRKAAAPDAGEAGSAGGSRRSLRAHETTNAPEVEALVPAPEVVELGAVLPADGIHVDPGRFHLSWTLPDGLALCYASGIGPTGLYEAGLFHIGAMKE